MAAGTGRRPVVAEGLVDADPTVLVWAEGEREQWLSRAAALDHGREEPDWVRVAASADRLSELSPPQVSWLVAKGPEASARALLGTPLFLRQRRRIDIGRVAVARFELDALALALHEAGEEPDRLGLLVLPFRGPAVATLIAGWLRHLGSARLWARLWLGRHPEAAARALIPAAVARPGRARQNAEDALRHLAATGHGEVISKTSQGYGMAASDLLPGPAPSARKGKPPAWRLPEIRRTDGATMPADDVVRLVTALTRARLSPPPEPPPGDPAPHRPASSDSAQPGPASSDSARAEVASGHLPPYDSGLPLIVESSAAAQPLVEPADPGLAQLISGSDASSLAAFGRALLDEWLSADMPAAEAWVVLAQVHLGDDATMDRLAPLVRSWPARSRYARAIDGYAVLATVGTDVALRHLLAIEENMSGGATNERAVVHLTQAAAVRGLSVTQLADRLAVSHGLEDGITLDYGPRVFTVATDDQLTPYVLGPDGRRLARPPKPGARDTGPEAYERFLGLKKALRVTAAAQIARLERDMLARRLRPARDLTDVLLPHPVLGPIARRLLWREHDGRQRVLRVAEDGSFADRDDATARVDGDTTVRIVHPVELGDDLPGWAQIIADYEILQPFPQVNRPLVRLTEAERAATGLTGSPPPATERIVRMLRERWQGNGFGTASRVHDQLTRGLPGGLTLVVELDPGVATSSAAGSGDQRITEIWLDDTWSDHWQVARRVPMGAGDPAALSELLVELYGLSG
jgi:Domain of unknown function (DUF4132)